MASEMPLSLEIDLSERRSKGMPFPGTMEQAAFLLVGLRPPETVPERMRGKLIALFQARAGIHVYIHVCDAVVSGHMKSLDIVSLFDWALSHPFVSTVVSQFVREQYEEWRSGAESAPRGAAVKKALKRPPQSKRAVKSKPERRAKRRTITVKR